MTDHAGTVASDESGSGNSPGRDVSLTSVAQGEDTGDEDTADNDTGGDDAGMVEAAGTTVDRWGLEAASVSAMESPGAIGAAVAVDPGWLRRANSVATSRAVILDKSNGSRSALAGSSLTALIPTPVLA